MVKDSIGTFITKIIVMAFAIIVSVIINRSLGADGRGQLAVVVLVPQILWVLGSFGLDFANIYYSGKTREKIPIIISNSIWLGLFFGFAFILIVSAVWILSGSVVKDIDKYLLGVPGLYFFLMLLTVPPYLVAYFLDSSVYGMDKIHARNIKEIFTNAFLLVVTAIMVTDPSARAPLVNRSFGFGLNMGIFGAAISQLFFVTFIVIYSLFLVSRFSKWRLMKFDWAFFIEAMRYIGFYAYGATAATFLFHRIGIFILTYYIANISRLTNVDLGLFTTASTIMEKLMVIPGSIVYALLPKVTSKSSDEIIVLTSKVSRHTLIVTLITIGFLSIFISPILVFLYGREYEPAKYPFWWLAPGIVLLSMGRVYGTHLLGIGKAYYAFYFSICTLILNTILNIVLIPLMGINGSAIATSIAYAFQTFLMYYAFKRETKIGTGELFLLRRDDFNVYSRGMRELWRYFSRS